MKIRVTDQMFTQKELLFLDYGELKAYLYRFDSGVPCIKLENSAGYITVLPFHGQMVWDAVFFGRALKMQTSFKQPKQATLFRDTYGCYIMHCGALGMGCPSKEDTHAHHGELPYARYDQAYIIAGEDQKGTFIAVGGEYEYHRAFDSHYLAKPLVKLYEGSSMIEVNMTIQNLSSSPMEYMYMNHVNNAVSPGAKIYQTLPWTQENMVVRVSIPQYNEPNPVFLELLTAIQNDVKKTQIVQQEDRYDPEIVLFLREVKTDKSGFAHFLYEHQDGTADYTTYDARVLDHGVRWIVNHEDWRSMGMVLPSTAEPEGYIAEKAKGNVRKLDAHESFTATVIAGCLNQQQTKEKKELIRQVMGEDRV